MARLTLFACVCAVAAVAQACRGQGRAVSPPPASQGDRTVTTRPETATFAAGCFWGVQAAFDDVPGVLKTIVGYTGGHTEKPTYKQVGSDATGHAEAVEVVFDPARVSYEKLVEFFFGMHNPTTPNRQGPDVGSQYRSAIFTHSPEQSRTAAAVRDRLAGSGTFRSPIVTEIVAAQPFWPAEEYHQKYFAKTGQGACHTKP